jgi:hypothetical protein
LPARRALAPIAERCASFRFSRARAKNVLIRRGRNFAPARSFPLAGRTNTHCNHASKPLRSSARIGWDKARRAAYCHPAGAAGDPIRINPRVIFEPKPANIVCCHFVRVSTFHQQEPREGKASDAVKILRLFAALAWKSRG